MRLALLLFITSVSLTAQDTLLLVSQKAASTVGFYTWEGQHLDAVQVGKHPHEMVLSTDGRYAYTTDNGTMAIEVAGQGGNTVSFIDLKERRRVAQVSLGKYHRPHGIDVNPVTGDLLISSENPDQLIVVDVEEKRVARTFDTKGRTSHIVTCDAKGEWAYVSNARSSNVSAIHLTTGETILIPAGDRPAGSVLSNDGKTLYVSNRESNEITAIDTAAKKLVFRIPTCTEPARVGLSGDNQTLIYACITDQQVGFADVASRKQVALVDLNASPVSLTTSPDGKHAFAGAQDQDMVFVISIADRKIAKKFKTTPGAGPDPIRPIRKW
jgi:YVTN family beta-propeller protein